MTSSNKNVLILVFLIISHSLAASVTVPAIYNFSLTRIAETLQNTKFIEYTHIPKCGTVSRKICDEGQLPCLPLPQLRKCGYYGEHCD